MNIPLLDHQKTESIESIQRYMSKEIDVDVSEMQAEMILDYFSKEFAPFAYNKGIEDARQFLVMKAEDLSGTCFEEGLTYWNGKKKSAGVVRRKPSY